jgi:hypothetical protein
MYVCMYVCMCAQTKMMLKGDGAMELLSDCLQDLMLALVQDTHTTVLGDNLTQQSVEM